MKTMQKLKEEYAKAKKERELMDAAAKVAASRCITLEWGFHSLRSIIKKEEEKAIIDMTRFKETCGHQWALLASGHGKDFYKCKLCEEIKTEE